MRSRSRLGEAVQAPGRLPSLQPQGAALSPSGPRSTDSGGRACTLCPGGAAVSCKAELSAEGAAGPLLPVLVNAVLEALPVRLQGHTCLGEGNKDVNISQQWVKVVLRC